MVLLVLVGIAGASVVGWVAATAASAPAITTLKERDPGSNTEVLAADGTRLGFISADELSRPIDGDRMPQVLKDATVAIEDERFYKPPGRRLRGHHARRGQELHEPRDRRGRLDADHAAGQEPLHRRPHAGGPRRLPAQDPRGEARRGARDRALEGVDPRPSTSTRRRTGRSAGRPRSAPRPPRACTSTSAPSSSTCTRRRCWPASRRRRPRTRRSRTGPPPSAAATRCWRRWPSSAWSPTSRPSGRCGAGSTSTRPTTSAAAARATSSTTSRTS